MLEAIQAVVDASVISSDVDAFALHGVKPGMVLEPHNVEQAAAIMRAATEHQLRVECAGNNTQPVGNRRTRADVVISTRRMDSIVEYDAADLVIGVQAGMRLRAVQQHTRRNGQFFAQDPPATEHSTIGGIIAAARSGPGRFAYGTPRDHVLGLQVVSGDGRVLNFGGRVVKNVAGYDLVRLLVGSAGTLALITSAFLRLRPLPQKEATLMLGSDGPAPLSEVAQFITDEHLEAVAVELASPGVLRENWTLLVRFAGNQEAVADALMRLRTRGQQDGLSAQDASDAEWLELEQTHLDAETIVRLADLPTRMTATLQAAEKLAARMNGASIIAHAGDGIVRVYGRGNDVEPTAFAIGEARTLLGVSGGSVIIQSRNAELMRRVDAYGGAGATMQLMSRLKQIFDPGNVLAPGRFIT